MSEQNFPTIGSVTWRDLTVDNAEEIKDFYQQVIGWTATPHDMGDYNDFDIHAPETGEVVAGICHARGENANIPPAWLMYIVVADVEVSARMCVELGGQVVDGPRPMGDHLFCVICDPAGAVAALFSQKPAEA